MGSPAVRGKFDLAIASPEWSAYVAHAQLCGCCALAYRQWQRCEPGQRLYAEYTSARDLANALAR